MTRSFAAIASNAQWSACTLEGSTLELSSTKVTLSRIAHSSAPQLKPEAETGLALDESGLVYRCVSGRIFRQAWAPLGSGSARAQVEELTLPMPTGLNPLWLACDRYGLLYVASKNESSVAIFDVETPRLLRVLRLSSAVRRLFASAGRVYAVTAGALVLLDARQDPIRATGLPANMDAAAWLPGERPVALVAAGTASARLAWQHEPPLAVPWAIDLAVTGDGALIVACLGSPALRRFALFDGKLVEQEPLDAPHFDGTSVVAGPGAALGYFTVQGDLRVGTAGRFARERRGLVTSFALDAGYFGARWGMLRIDACLPRGTGLRFRAWTSDEPEQIATEVDGGGDRLALLDERRLALQADSAAFQTLYRRGDLELPWTVREDELITYEAPIVAAAGRYLWIVLELSGDGRHTPSVGALRAEREAHALMRRLPRAFSRDAGAEGFLHRFLTIADGFLGELEARSLARHALLDPHTAPAEALPFIASFLGVVLDQRLSEAGRRRLLTEFNELCRKRGTMRGIERTVELALGVAPVRVLEDQALPRPSEGQSPYHFRVLVPAALDAEELALVHDLVKAASPAHTSFDVRTGAPGMVLGGELYVGITTVVGYDGTPSSSLGGAVLGKNAVLGRARPSWTGPLVPKPDGGPGT